jgi:hypothetical protein
VIVMNCRSLGAGIDNLSHVVIHKLSTMGLITPYRRKYRLRLGLEKMARFMGQGACILPWLWYNVRMATTNTNGSTTRTTNKGSRKGPRPIQTVAQLKENLLRDALAKEIKKIDRKLSVATRKRAAANARATDATRMIDELNRIRADFLRESNLAPKA